MLLNITRDPVLTFNLIRLPEILKFLNAIKNQLDKDLKDVLDVNKDVATINVSIAM